VQPKYSFDHHFGQIHYLFVRGVRPDWRNPDGSPSGVFTHRPMLETLEELSSILDGKHLR
jgi:exodeoxyribonuclease V beta subunit